MELVAVPPVKGSVTPINTRCAVPDRNRNCDLVYKAEIHNLQGKFQSGY